jgi:hypothetical protein
VGGLWAADSVVHLEGGAGMKGMFKALIAYRATDENLFTFDAVWAEIKRMGYNGTKAMALSVFRNARRQRYGADEKGYPSFQKANNQ